MGKAAFTPTDEQTAIIDAARTEADLKVIALAGTGKTTTMELASRAMPDRKGLYLAFNKALRNDQPVLTPDGWKAIGDMKVGDLVIGRDGQPHQVTKVHPRGVRPMYEVVFSDGTVVVADEDHLWLTQTITYDATPRSKVKWRTRTTQQIAETVHQQHRMPHLSAPASLRYRDDLPISPYLLGTLIGDGSFVNHMVRFSCAEQELVELVRSELPEGHKLNQIKDSGRERSYSITRGTMGRKNSNQVMAALRDLGLQGHRSGTKFIPRQYLFAGPEQRLAILQGLMDTDGHASGPRSILSTTSKQLAEDVVFLAQSLGGVASISTKGTTGGYLVNVRIAKDLVPFRLSRKVEAWHPRKRDEQTPRKIVEVRQVPPAEATCISIDADDHLFLTAGCVPTHNSVQLEADQRFPASVTAKTAHSLAYGKVGRKFRDRLNGPRVPAWQLAERFAVEGFSMGEDHQIPPRAIAATAAGTVRRFTHSADTEISRRHVLRLDGLTPAAQAALADHILPYAEAIWADLQDPGGDKAKFEHDTYLKIWALTDPVLPYDYIVMDEAQDANPVLLDVLSKQDQSQRILVGDPNQAIYGWRGAHNALGSWKSQSTLNLTESFRFGPEVAAEANKWLQIPELECDLRVVGRGPEAVIGPVGHADAILCRTNAGAVGEALDLIDRPRERVAIVGGGKAIKDMALAAIELQTGKTTSHPELAAFENWEAVREYVRAEEGAEDLAVFVRLVDKHGPDVLIDGVEALVDERRGRPTTTISTAHKAKGREWPSVRVGSDFFEPGLDEYGKLQRLDKSEAMLCYVTVTRAKRHLDNDSLAWVDYYLAGNASPEQQRRWIERQGAKGADDDDPAPGSAAAVKQFVREQRAEEREYTNG